MVRWWRTVKHRVFGVCDWEGCRCRICRVPRETGHEWDGCKCIRCPQTRHAWDGCRCRNCDAERHEWSGLTCRCCHAQKDVRALLLKHFPNEVEAIDDLLIKLHAIDGFDWGAVYDWQMVEVTRETIECYRHGADYALAIAAAPSGVGAGIAGSHPIRGYVAPCPILIKRSDAAPARLIH